MSTLCGRPVTCSPVAGSNAPNGTVATGVGGATTVGRLHLAALAVMVGEEVAVGSRVGGGRVRVASVAAGTGDAVGGGAGATEAQAARNHTTKVHTTGADRYWPRAFFFGIRPHHIITF